MKLLFSPFEIVFFPLSYLSFSIITADSISDLDSFAFITDFQILRTTEVKFLC